jgi:hypothetical protein
MRLEEFDDLGQMRGVDPGEAGPRGPTGSRADGRGSLTRLCCGTC